MQSKIYEIRGLKYKIMKKIMLCAMTCILVIVGTFCLASCKNDKEADIISTYFSGYDFTRAVVGDNDLTYSMLLTAGQEIHSYDPSVTDIKAVTKCKLFIYIGGESDEWVESDILPEINKKKTTVISMFKILEDAGVNLYEEEDPSSSDSEEEHGDGDVEYDEHVWTNPAYAKIIVNGIRDAIIALDSDNSESYTVNALTYTNELDRIDSSYRSIVEASTNKMIVVADRFPLLYFVKAYGLSYDAAFNGCSSDTEASAKTIASLVSKVEQYKLKYIFVIELNETKIVANAIVDEIKQDSKNGSYDDVAPEILTFYTMHNVSKKDFKKGVTYIDMSNKNIEALTKAL